MRTYVAKVWERCWVQYEYRVIADSKEQAAKNLNNGVYDTCEMTGEIDHSDDGLGGDDYWETSIEWDEGEELSKCRCELCGCGALVEGDHICDYCAGAHPDYHRHDCYCGQTEVTPI